MESTAVSHYVEILADKMLKEKCLDYQNSHFIASQA